MFRKDVLARALSWPIALSLVAAACGGGGTTSATSAPTTAPTASALNWPTQPITLIVPFAAGGDTDIPMRVVAEFLGKELGQPVVVQNVSGGSGTTGTRQAKNAKPDGYTLVSIHEHTIINQHTGLVDYGPLDLEPIALLVTSAGFLATESSNPWNDLASLIDDAKKRPNEITWGVTFGSTAQMWAFLFMHKTGTKFRPVGYDGTAQRVTALLGKQIHLGETPLSTAQAQVKAGKLKVLGYAWTARDPRLPDVKTMREQGVDAIFATSRGWAAPKGTPAEILKKLETALQKVMANPELKQKIEDEQGSIVEFLPRDRYIEKLRAQDVELKKVIAETGMKAQ
ncbi:MAG TPA: tripartite tricarboxylate transporter substrate binding protein [Candidatus Limnocylindria bacterium]|jgi:tripartite-type tricarboxylate transporter receptor subunit TctC|nr:tripartite tricarboxylate transporter substrate binding protein [Candidatus Limnocylindria bacterium]